MALARREGLAQVLAVALIPAALEAREHRGASGAVRGEACGVVRAPLLGAPRLLWPLAQAVPTAQALVVVLLVREAIRLPPLHEEVHPAGVAVEGLARVVDELGH